MAKIEKVSAIILSAGLSKRMGRDKQFLKLKKKHIIEITLKNFLDIPSISQIILALSESNIKKYACLFKNKKIKIVNGGKTRMESLRNSFSFISPDSELIAVHDGARPFIKKELIINTLESALKYGAAVPAVPVKDTIKEVNDKFEVVKTLNRKIHYAVQTPQCYKKEILKEILNSSYSYSDLSDESQVLEKLGKKIKIVLGDYFNIKITTKEDLIFAEAIYEKKYS